MRASEKVSGIRVRGTYLLVPCSCVIFCATFCAIGLLSSRPAAAEQAKPAGQKTLDALRDQAASQRKQVPFFPVGYRTSPGQPWGRTTYRVPDRIEDAAGLADVLRHIVDNRRDRVWAARAPIIGVEASAACALDRSRDRTTTFSAGSLLRENLTERLRKEVQSIQVVPTELSTGGTDKIRMLGNETADVRDVPLSARSDAQKQLLDGAHGRLLSVADEILTFCAGLQRWPGDGTLYLDQQQISEARKLTKAYRILEKQWPRALKSYEQSRQDDVRAWYRGVMENPPWKGLL